jgi:iron complex transport system ATP-binding protein
MTPPLSCTQLALTRQRRRIIDDVTLSFNKGQFVGLIGPNGAGKSTLLKLLMGLLEPTQGEVALDDQPLRTYSKREIARRIAFVPQDTAIGYAFNVREIVAMGRTPYLGAFRPETDRDSRIIHQALEKTDLLPMAGRRTDQLSGGERQRVFIARALAQETSILFMDEPTASLDLCHQLEVMNLAKRLSDDGKLVIAAIHDLAMASRFCDRLILLSEGKISADGSPEQVLTEDNLSAYFAINAHVEKSPLAAHSLRITPLSACARPSHKG